MVEAWIALSDIKQRRGYRDALDDVAELQASIEHEGLRHPIVLLLDGHTLLAGARRIRAVEGLGWATIPAVTPTQGRDAAAELIAEREDPIARLPMGDIEMVRQGLAFELIDAPQRAHNLASGRIAPSERRGYASDTTAAALGMPVARYQRIRLILRAQQGADPALREAADRALAMFRANGQLQPAYDLVLDTRDPERARNRAAKRGHPRSDVSRNRAARARDRVWAAVNSLEVIASQVPNMDLSVVRQAARNGEIAEMTTRLNEATLALRRFSKDFAGQIR